MSPRVPARSGARRAVLSFAGTVTRIRDCLAKAVHRYFHENGYYWISTPIITTSDAEGAGQMFRVSTLDMANLPRGENGGIDFSRDFFGKETFLTMSGQLNVEAYCLCTEQGLPSARPSVPRTATPPATWPSSGWCGRDLCRATWPRTRA